MLSITKLFEFEAAHFLPGYQGKCKNLHGHSYKLEVEISIKDKSFLKNFMIIDFSNFKDIVNNVVIDILDHSNLNEILSDPTAEKIVGWIVDSLSPIFNDKRIKLTRVRLWETSTSYVEWKKGDWKIYE